MSQHPDPCNLLLDPRDPLLHSERTQGCAADPDYWKGEVFAYGGLPQNLKDLKDPTVDLCLGSWRGPRGVGVCI